MQGVGEIISTKTGAAEIPSNSSILNNRKGDYSDVNTCALFWFDSILCPNLHCFNLSLPARAEPHTAHYMKMMIRNRERRHN